MIKDATKGATRMTRYETHKAHGGTDQTYSTCNECVAPVAQSAPQRRPVWAICNRCGTRCYGDCRAY